MEDVVNEVPKDTDVTEPIAKKSKKTLHNMSMLSFLTGAPKAINRTQSEISLNPSANKRDYSKNKHVCMLCAKDDNLKDKKNAILCRGTLHQIRRHYERRHGAKDVNYACFSREQFKDVFPINHAHVPSYFRTLSDSSSTSSMSKKDKQPNFLGNASSSYANLSNDLIDSDTETELEEENNDLLNKSEAALNDLHDLEQATGATTGNSGGSKAPVIKAKPMVQKGLESFVKTTKPEFEEKVLSMIENLSKKVDSLSKTPVHGTSAPSLPSTTFAREMESCYKKMKDWKDVKNIVELVSSIESLALYPLANDEDIELFKGGGAILRCETCYVLHKDKVSKLTPARAALKLSSQCNSICTGRYLDEDKMSQLMSGKGNYWRKLKSSVLQHMICATDGQTHFKALTLISEEANLKKKYYEAAETLLKCAITSVKSKSAALHYESQVAFAHAVGAQVGQCGHSRKLFPDLLKCLLTAVNEKTKQELLKCLPSTGFPPHFYMTVDKATVNKRSNQAVLICPMLSGRRVAIAVGAPEVYSSSEDGGVQGGKLADSANQAFDVLKGAYEEETLDYLIGISADGVYQASGFQDTVEANSAKDCKFIREVGWDAAHWIDLAVNDVKEGKVGTSKQFFANFISRTNAFADTLNRGKGRSILESTAKKLGVRATVSAVYSQTRFSSSAFVQWQRLYKSYGLFVEALTEALDEMDDEDSPLQYKVKGQDFVTDLLLMLDVFEPVATVMIQLQSISVPAWKCHRWIRQLIDWLHCASHDCYEFGNLDFFPKMKENAEDILEKDPENLDVSLRPVFQKTELCVGWKVTGQEVNQDTNGKHPKKTILVNWEERKIEDSFADVRSFATDLADSLNARLDKCASHAAQLATFFDVEETAKLVCGERLDCGRVQIDEGQLEEHGVHEFNTFFKEMCDLKHIKEARDNRFDHRMSSSVLRDWKKGIKHLIWDKEMKTTFLSCLDTVEKSGLPTSLAGDFDTVLEKMQPVQQPLHKMTIRQLFQLKYTNHEPFEAYIVEDEIVRALYTNEALYSIIGPVACTAFDVAMAMGGCEAVVESFYSVMDTQRQVGQDHGTLEDRTLVDWAMSNVLRSRDVVSRAARLYIDGNSDLGLPRHRVGYLKNTSSDSYIASQVLTRLRNEGGRYPFLE